MTFSYEYMISISTALATMSFSLIGHSFSYWVMLDSNSFLSGMKKVARNSSLTFFLDSFTTEDSTFFSFFSSSLNCFKYFCLYSERSLVRSLGFRRPQGLGLHLNWVRLESLSKEPRSSPKMEQNFMLLSFLSKGDLFQPQIARYLPVSSQISSNLDSETSCLAVFLKSYFSS